MSEYTTYISVRTDENGVIKTLESERLCEQLSNEEKYD